VPLISCIVPVRNGERYLAAAIDSILVQDHRPLEIVVVDDGSTDGSAALARAYGNDVRVVAQAPQGAPAARNRGIEEARGELLSFLDADDLYRPGKLSSQLEALDAAPGADLCLCHAENFWEPGMDEERIRHTALGRLRTSWLFGTLLARRSAFDRAGLLDTSLPAGDFGDWWLRAHDLGLTARVLDDVLVDRRMHRDSLTHGVLTPESYFDVVKRRIDRS
jgi:glycosyltransferase involved in cell wall biosynthesis